MAKYRKVNVMGHINPDTDSICAAISYTYLKNKLGPNIHEARRCGNISRETAFVLDHFKVNEPRLITSVRAQIKDLDYQEQEGIDGEMSLYAAWNKMRDETQDTLCITNEDNILQGLITVKDIANANMAIFNSDVLATSKTSYKNILETLNGKLILGDKDTVIESGHVCVGTSPEMMEDTLQPGDIVLVTNRYEMQRFAIESGASCIVLCCDAPASRAILSVAEQEGCAVITTPYDTYTATRLICMSIPVRALMLKDNILEFSVNTTVEEARKIMTSTRHRYFPVIKEDGTFSGVMSSPNIININRKHVILVDHNEQSQAVDGLKHAIVLQIIDHHRIGNIETTAPALFRNEPVGCTCTIIKEIFDEQGIEIPKNIAGLMMSAIISDTLMFRSPTCTPLDEKSARELSEICGENIEKYANEMFEAGGDLTGRDAEDVFHGDFKVYSQGSAHFGVGQSNFMTQKNKLAAEELLKPYLKDAAANEGLPLIFYMFTDIKQQTTELLYYGEHAESIIKAAFNVDPQGGKAILPGVMSRKKQVVPALMVPLQLRSEDEE